MNVDETDRLALLFSSHNIFGGHSSPALQSSKAQSWPNSLKLCVLGAPGVVIMKSCPGLEQADYRDNEGLGCCRVIAAPLQDSGPVPFFSFSHIRLLGRAHISASDTAAVSRAPAQAKRAHFTTCMCDLANLHCRARVCVCVCRRRWSGIPHQILISRLQQQSGA